MRKRLSTPSPQAGTLHAEDYCAAAMLSLLFVRETRNISLDDLDSKMMPVSDLKAEEAVP
jgi:hypothetical protein